MVDISYDGNDRWSIPDDRQLALRGRLETGWSSYRGNVFSHNSGFTLSDEEQQLIYSVLQRQEAQQTAEQQRIGLLVKNLEYMRKNVLGDGSTTCLICGTKTGLLKDALHFCAKCEMMVCSKCSIATTPLTDNSTKVHFCVLCYEERQLWKRSGAWFYNSIPKYLEPDRDDDMSSRSGSVHRPTSQQGSSSRGSSLPHLYMTNTESIDEVSDDSDIETASTKAFDISEDAPSITWHGQIDVEEESVMSRTKRSSEVVTQRPGTSRHVELVITHDEDTNSNMSLEDRFGSRSSFSRIIESPRLTSRQVPTIERQISQGSLSSPDPSKQDKRHKLVIRKPWRKKSRDMDGSISSAQSNNSPTLSKQLSNGNADKADRNSSASDQDIDAIFQSYGDETQNKNDETPYKGKYGMVEFTLQYDPNTQELLVIIHKCNGLKGDKGKQPSAYIKTFLLPEATKASKKRTSTIKRSTEPVFDETIVYHGVAEGDIEAKGLRLSVMDDSRLGNSGIIGEIAIPLKNLTTRPVQHFRRILDARSNDQTLFLDTKNTGSNPGRIEIALHYLSKQEKLVVEIIRCSGLKALDPNGYSDPYVKCYLLPDPHKRTKQKTNVKKKTLNPEFNEEFSYKIPHGELAKRTLHVSVWDYDIGRTNDLIGGITLGIDSTGEALRHWFETLKTADRRVIKWHTLSEQCPIINE